MAFVAISPDALAVNPANPARNPRKLQIANARTGFSYGSAGGRTGPQIGADIFKEVASSVAANVVHVPFEGGAPAITAVLAMMWIACA